MSTKPRTCCPTHSDACRFGREHLWSGPFLLDAGRAVNGDIWSAVDDVKCRGCGGICTAESAQQDVRQTEGPIPKYQDVG